MFRFFFDIDGVILNFESAYIKAIKNYFQLDIPDDYQARDWFFKDILTEKQLNEGWKYFTESEHFGTMPSLIVPEKFNQTFGNYPVHFITNIPPTCLEKRKKNLMSLGFQWESIFCAGKISYDNLAPLTKSEVILQLKQPDETIMFVDDHPDNCLDVWKHVPKAQVWLMSRPFNSEFKHDGIRRANNWEDLIDFSKDLIIQKN